MLVARVQTQCRFDPKEINRILYKMNKNSNSVERLDIKAQQLEFFANTVFDNPIYKNEIEALLDKLNLTKKEIIESYVNYDLDIFAYSNEIYSPLVMRMVLHIHNILQGSWHIERQKNICDFLQIAKPRSIIDIGFGVPTLYIKKALEKQDLQITLTDIEESAFTFAENLLAVWSPNWKKNITLKHEDMVQTSENPPESSLYLFQDSIEHVLNPTKCLQNFVKNSKQDAQFILSLPIGQITPIHYIAWHTREEIIEWLNKCGLKITVDKQIYVNPRVDLFAEQHNFRYSNLVVLCSKI